MFIPNKPTRTLLIDCWISKCQVGEDHGGCNLSSNAGGSHEPTSINWWETHGPRHAHGHRRSDHSSCCGHAGAHIHQAASLTTRSAVATAVKRYISLPMYS